MMLLVFWPGSYMVLLLNILRSNTVIENKGAYSSLYFAFII